MQDIRNLRVWHEARALARLVYELTAPVPARAFPGQVSQIRRAATSVGANIAEGAAFRSRREFARFLQQAIASATEVEHHAQVAVDLAMLTSEHGERIAVHAKRLQRMLVVLHRRVSEAIGS
jgi:four helix bundle protein